MKPLVSCDRNAPWLSQIKGGWEKLALKYSAKINARTLPESTNPEREIRYIDISSVSSAGRIEKVELMQFRNAPSRTRRVVRYGDTLVSMVRTYLRAVAPVPEEDTDLIASTGFAVVSPRQSVLYPQFLAYWLQSKPFVDEVCARSVGVSYPATNASEVGAIPSPLPPLPTQKTIADYLDEKTAAIDTLIEKKRKLLDLLAEERAALINQAVTKGLDPTVPMKDSGIPWIGEIPVHWDLLQLRRLVRRIEQGWSPLCENREADENEWGVLKVGCVNGGVFRASENKAIPENLSPIEALEIHEGDLLMSRANTKELLGSTAVVPNIRPRLMLCDKLYRIRLSPRCKEDFFSLAMASTAGRNQFEAQSSGASSSMQNIGQERLLSFVLPFPPLEEETVIAGAVQSSLGQIRGMASKIEEQMSRLQEYRQALITAAVTGQLDIGAAA